MTFMRRGAALLGAAIVLASISAASAVELRALSGWDQTYPARPYILDQYAKNVEAASKGDIKFVISGPETVSALEQLEPASSGVFQVLLTNGGYHFGTTPFLIPVEGFSGDLAKWREAKVNDVVDQHYRKHNLKLLALARTPDGAFQLILRAPVSKEGDLAGRKIRGTQNYAGMINMLGASPVVMPAPEIYPALERGVIDGAGWPVIGILANRWNEPARYLLRPSFGVAVYPVFMNLDAWNKLTPAQQKIMLEEGRKIEDTFYSEWSRLVDEEHKKLLAAGSTITEMGAEQRKKMAASWSDALWAAARSQKNATDIDSLHAFAKKNGLSN